MRDSMYPVHNSFRLTTGYLEKNIDINFGIVVFGIIALLQIACCVHVIARHKKPYWLLVILLLSLLGVLLYYLVNIYYPAIEGDAKPGNLVGEWHYITYPDARAVYWETSIPNHFMAALATHFTAHVLQTLESHCEDLITDLEALLENPYIVSHWKLVSVEQEYESDSLNLQYSFGENGFTSFPHVLGPMRQETSRIETAKVLVYTIFVRLDKQAKLLRNALTHLITMHRQEGPIQSIRQGIIRANRALNMGSDHVK